jgi:prophage DNA circulation protein
VTIVLSRGSFGDIIFPVIETTVMGGQRNHVHEYPHVDGGDIEKLGRKPYIIRMVAWFHELEGVAALNYPDLWPGGLKRLRQLLESGSTEDLVVPTLGTIRAFPTAWTLRYVIAQAIDGEKAELEFVEDQEGAFGNEMELAANSLAEAAVTFDLEAELRAYLGKERKPGLFESINDAVNSVLAIRDQAGAQASLVASKIAFVQSLCEEAERTVDFLGGADAAPLATALRNLWNTSADLAAKVGGSEETLLYTVPERTTIDALAMRLYGKTEKVGSLLKKNAFRDPYAIEAGTQVLYAV